MKSFNALTLIRSLSVGAVVIVWMMSVESLSAHQFWMQLESQRVSVGQVVPVRLFVGEGFPGESYARNPDHILRFESESNGVRRAIAGFPNQDPAGFFIARNSGFHIIRYISRDSQVNLPAAQFNQYLTEEGLTDVLETRISRGEGEMDVREKFRRCATAYIQVGHSKSAHSSNSHSNCSSELSAGLELQLDVVPADGSDLWEAGSEFCGRLLENGKSSPGRLIKFFHEDTPGQPVITKWSDDNGEFEATLDQPGTWMLSCVTITGQGQNYNSVWTSLTFVVHPNKLTP